MAERFGKLEVVERDPDRLVLRTPRASLGRWCLFYLLGPSIFIVTRTFLLLQIVTHIPFEKIVGLQLRRDEIRGLQTSHVWKAFLRTVERSVCIDTGTSYHGMHALVAEISQLTAKPIVPPT